MRQTTKKYKSVATTNKIMCTSRASIKRGDSYYTVEYAEERLLPQDVKYDINEERKILWDTVNTEVDNQIEDIIKTYK